MLRPIKILFVPVVALLILMACKNREKRLGPGEEPVQISDFISLFDPLTLPWQTSDTNLVKKDNDSFLISHPVFVRFIPDSILRKAYAKNVEINIYPIGRVDAGSEIYLFAKTKGNNRKNVFVLAFDKKEQFLTGLPLFRPSTAQHIQSVSMDRSYTLTRSIHRKNRDGSFSEGKDVYVFNAEAREFTLIMTEALDDKMTEMINPIDSMPRKHKYSADYSNAKMSLVSIRDGRKSDRLSFFIHFEKNNGECTGELRGEAIFRSANVAEYRKDGDPCVLKFIFSKSSVTLREVEGCGSRRGLRCTFDASYPKKTEPKAPSK